MASVIAVTAFFIFSNVVLADLASGILVDVIPENPAPFEEVRINLSSYSENLDTAMITWSVRGQSILSGVGKKSFNFKAGDNGSETSVNVSISLPGGLAKRVITVKPSTLTILWQAEDSYVPPFYKGKALPVADSGIKVVAIPEIKSGLGTISPKNFVYAWRKDYTNDQEASGYGKSSFTYLNDYLDDSSNIEVTASTADSKSSTKGSLDIRTFLPKISFYKKDAVYGIIFERAILQNHRIEEAEEVFAAPYFISPKSIRMPSLVFTWSLNGAPVSLPSAKKNLIPLKRGGGVSGVAKLRLDIENRDKIFQSAQKEINIEF